MPTLIGILLGIFLTIGFLVGHTDGQSGLCRDQFKGEMHEGKCVKVQREELK